MRDENGPVLDVAQGAAIRAYDWHDRGEAPPAYVDGMAIAFADAWRGLRGGDAAVAVIAAAIEPDPAGDVLDWYAAPLAAAGLSSRDAGDRLIGVFTIMLGLGMRESSGEHCEGRDTNATNFSADTAEAGLFQVSHDSIPAHPRLQLLFDDYRGRDDLVEVFLQGVACSAASWADWGDGAGRDFQTLMKACPRFAVLYTGVLLRHQRSHWGPLNRREVEVRADAVTLFRAVARAIDRG